MVNKDSQNITILGKSNYWDRYKTFGIKDDDRLLHSYIIGKTGTGKSTLLKGMLMQDIERGDGICLMDPHGDLVSEIFDSIPESRRADVIYFNTPDAALKFRYNPFKRVSFEKRSLVASGILESLKKLWNDAWGVKLEHILRHCILALLDQRYASIEDIQRLLLDKTFRNSAIQSIENDSVKRFWEKEFKEYNKYDLLPVLNKLGGILAHPVIKRTLISNPEEISLRKSMDNKKIILVNLSKGHIGEDASQILGALFVTSVASASFSRASLAESERIPFHFYIDEFHNFTTLSLVNMFAELRKFKIAMTLAHQYLHQLDDKIRRAVIGNVGTVLTFRLGSDDAIVMAREMFPDIALEDFIHLPNYHFFIRLIIDGKPSRGFSAFTIPPQSPPKRNSQE